MVASYRIEPRKALKPGGVTLIAALDDRDYEIDAAICGDGSPGETYSCGSRRRPDARIRDSSAARR